MRANDSSKRKGQALVFFLVFFMAVVGVMALTLDYGFVLLSRRSMQAAANTAALEGGRYLNDTGRGNANTVVRNLFDDDLDPSQNNSTLGAGVSQDFLTSDVDGNTILGAGNGARNVWNARNQYLYRPDPQLNTGNALHGDLVVGDYQNNSQTHHEASNYQRDDFIAAASGDSFLARLRRTPSRSGVANSLDREPGISSSGSGSPIIFGRLLPFIPQSTGYDLRLDGVPIRATAIAQQKPVVQVGTSTDENVYQAINYAKDANTSTYYEIPSPAYTIGSQVILGNQVTDPTTIGSGYLPIVSDYAGATYVVAFQLRLDTANPYDRQFNATAHLHHAWPTLDGLSSDQYEFVTALHASLADDTNSGIAKMPALTRAID